MHMIKIVLVNAVELNVFDTAMEPQINHIKFSLVSKKKDCLESHYLTIDTFRIVDNIYHL